nr:MAG TPA: hypothetical protein [Caudoviricetes sp.]
MLPCSISSNSSKKIKNIVVIGFYRYLYLIVIRKHLFHAYIVSDFGGIKQVIKV